MICKLLVEKNGVSAIERIMEIHRDTVSDVSEDLARHARAVTDYLITNVGLTQPWTWKAFLMFTVSHET
uniref:Uncharacterized protein n=1 Tax=Candidatus Methanophaga sp. ANME-1 ERB7 TaxID=2759913 RepID=A0A7G9Z4L0_9EURY|nr:hypothetical protein KHGGAAHM_00021 [Methanosarcinales archaeon ANME-1 ERB7]